jgi:hypothetical protein
MRWRRGWSKGLGRRAEPLRLLLRAVPLRLLLRAEPLRLLLEKGGWEPLGSLGLLLEFLLLLLGEQLLGLLE